MLHLVAFQETTKGGGVRNTLDSTLENATHSPNRLFSVARDGTPEGLEGRERSSQTLKSTSNFLRTSFMFFLGIIQNKLIGKYFRYENIV